MVELASTRSRMLTRLGLSPWQSHFARESSFTDSHRLSSPSRGGT